MNLNKMKIRIPQSNLFIGAFILVGLTIAVFILSFSAKDLNKAIQKSPSQDDSSKIKANIFYTSKDLKAAPEDTDLKTDYKKIEKTKFTLKYENKTSADLKHLQLWVHFVGGDEFGVQPSNGKFSTTTKRERGYLPFDVSDLKAGSTRSTDFFVFSKKAGSASIQVELRSDGKLIAKTNAIVVTAQ